MSEPRRPTLDEWRVLALRLEQALACAVDSVRPGDPMAGDYRAALRDAKAVRLRDVQAEPTDG